MSGKEATNLAIAEKLGLLPEEYEKIKELIGREPNFSELSAFSAMWSEHASYKNSIRWIKKLPRKGGTLLFEGGDENAGVVNLGNGFACVFKIESHNHPCAIEPYLGASSGVGGINRDIFTMGARPVAQLNSLRFGNINEPRTKWLLKRVVKGIGDYGNTLGVPMVGGETYFDESYHVNPLVNIMSVGIVEKSKIVTSASKTVGNKVYIIGAGTGRDGIRAAVFASAEITHQSTEDISSIQVGDPFQEKILLEATQDLVNNGFISAMQDLGAAGIVGSSSEMAAKGKHGMNIYLDKVPLRHNHMEPWEVMLSESQERMLVIANKGKEKEICTIAAKWDLQCACIGEVVKENKMSYFNNGELIASLPTNALVVGGGAPEYEREAIEPAYIKENKKFSINKIPEPANIKEVFWFMIAQPNIVSKKWIYEQFDTTVGGTNMSTNMPSDAAVINLKGHDAALVMTVDCNSRYVYADPEKGAEIAVAEASRNIICSGGEPTSITNCLNFGDPHNPEVYWQFMHVIQGMSKACHRFNTPVSGGNVSFYNQANIDNTITPVHPTPIIGMIGLLRDNNFQMTMAFKSKGDMIFLIGRSQDDIAGSEYLYSWHGIKESPAPWFDLEKEYEIQMTVKGLIKNHLIRSAHDVSDGGLAVALVESGLISNFGFDITSDAEVRLDAFLFGEAQGRIIVTVSTSRETEFIDFMLAQKVPFSALGHVTKEELRIDDVSFGFISDVKKEFENILEQRIDGRLQPVFHSF